MIVLPKTADRFTSFILYTILVSIVLLSGIKFVNSSKRVFFYYNYLLKWENALTRVLAMEVKLPQFKGNNHMEYMKNLTVLMGKESIEVPVSNTKHPYIYKISEKWPSLRQDIFLLFLENRVILYGLSKKIFHMLDKKIDGKIDKKSGNFMGQLQKNGINYVGIWKL